jgi:hypothetical protein
LPSTPYQNWWSLSDWRTLIKSDAFRGDASAVAKTSAAHLEKVIAALDEAKGFLGQAALRRLVGSIVKDAEQARGVASFIFNLYSLQRQFGDSFLTQFQRDFDDHAPLDPVERSRISAALPRLLAKRPAAERHAKAERLSERIGGHLAHFSITCDLRPVFDEKRDVIEAMFPVATLKVEAHEMLPVTLTARLSAKQIERILEEATNAQKKVAALRALLAQRGIEMPEAGVQAEADEDEQERDMT